MSSITDIPVTHFLDGTITDNETLSKFVFHYTSEVLAMDFVYIDNEKVPDPTKNIIIQYRNGVSRENLCKIVAKRLIKKFGIEKQQIQYIARVKELVDEKWDSGK